MVTKMVTVAKTKGRPFTVSPSEYLIIWIGAEEGLEPLCLAALAPQTRAEDMTGHPSPGYCPTCCTVDQVTHRIKPHSLIKHTFSIGRVEERTGSDTRRPIE